MAITAADVKKLREMSGAGMMDCKKALTETDGDFDAAIEFLRKKGLAAAEKKAAPKRSAKKVEALLQLRRRLEESQLRVSLLQFFQMMTRQLPSSRLTPRQTLLLRTKYSRPM